MLITANYMILTVFPEPFKGWSDMINHRVSVVEVVEVVVDIRSQNDRMNNSLDWRVRRLGPGQGDLSGQHFARQRSLHHSRN